MKHHFSIVTLKLRWAENCSARGLFHPHRGLRVKFLALSICRTHTIKYRMPRKRDSRFWQRFCNGKHGTRPKEGARVQVTGVLFFVSPGLPVLLYPQSYGSQKWKCLDHVLDEDSQASQVIVHFMVLKNDACIRKPQFSLAQGWAGCKSKLARAELVGGLVAIFYFPINIGLLIIPIDFHIFQRGGPTTNRRRMNPCYLHLGLHRIWTCRTTLTRVTRWMLWQWVTSWCFKFSRQVAGLGSSVWHANMQFPHRVAPCQEIMQMNCACKYTGVS